MMIHILFLLFAAISIMGAFLVISARHPVKAVLSLALSLVGAAGVWLLLEAEFLAFSLIVVYVGAVMVLFLFVVMMLDVDIAECQEGFIRFWFLPALGGLLFFAILSTMITSSFSNVPALSPTMNSDYSNIKAVGHLLFSDFLYPFELAALLLLSAMVAAIALTFRGKQPNTRTIDPVKQIHVTASSRLKWINPDVQRPMNLSPTKEGEGS